MGQRLERWFAAIEGRRWARAFGRVMRIGVMGGIEVLWRVVVGGLRSGQGWL